MEEKNNPLLCDPVEGICGIPDSATNSKVTVQETEKPIRVVYFTDPICSSCWGIEPQLRKLKLEYGDSIEFEYRMGGLLPDWSYNSGGISKPSDVAHHWDEVSIYYDMPIDGDVWLEDPLHSSYPPSIAFKAAQIQNNEKAILFLRTLREMVFLEKKNITKMEHLIAAAKKAGLDAEKLQADFEGKAKIEFEEDLNQTKKFGVRGFPTIFFFDKSGNNETVYGTKPYAAYESAILKLYSAAPKNEYGKTWESLFEKFDSLTAKEFSELSGKHRKEGEKLLNVLSDQDILVKRTTKNGSLWKRKVY
ncbi:ClpXP adapter SpxH family protein [Flavobacterium hibisci]|uniref:ClpXP adapter SpxH family protein n=1 Tax=Flavobacterium hibisci TaxID=1914462 RepID=UPI001CBD3292|nr:ClpXP adapter SpxH family protein [Flavobacterium hibisci]MBZ4042438.1 DsbA family protein [Flavobacterium hibisci]